MLTNKTISQVSSELAILISNYRQSIKTAFEKNEYDLTLSIKVNIKRVGEKNNISPSLEFYPESKIKSEKYTVSVDEKQIELPLKSVSVSKESCL